MIRFLLGVVAAAMLSMSAAAAEPELTPEEKAEVARLITLRDSLKPVRGDIPLAEAKARLNLAKGYYFLGPADARRVLTEGWGNPPSTADGVLGLIFPEGKTFLDEDSWGAVVTYEPTDYVEDKDAGSADYDKLLEQMRSSEPDANAERKKAGFGPIHLVGWAQPPTYDAARHDLIWARELQFGATEVHTLNYDVRHLGRHGVLSLNMVATMSLLPTVRTGAQDLARTVEFEPGARYADFKKGDKTAGYGLAGLVAAGAGLAVAQKAGLVGVILLFLKKGIAIFAIAGAAIAGWFRKMFGGKPKTAAVAPSVTEAETPEDQPPQT